MVDFLRDFIKVLRSSDVRISSSETLDAMKATSIIGFEDKFLLKESLSQSLAKSMREKEIFADCFENFFKEDFMNIDNASEDETNKNNITDKIFDIQSNEDLLRTKSYLDEKARQNSKELFVDLEAWLLNLKLNVEVKQLTFDTDEIGTTQIGRWGKCKLATVAFGHGIATTLLQLTKGYSIVTNGGYEINPTLIKKKYENDKIRLINQDVSNLINPILRKIVSTKEGTAGFANVAGFEVGGKTGTADQPADGEYSKKKINTFASVFPASDPKFALVVMLDEPKPNKEFVYNYRDGRQPYKGNWRNTAGWTTVWVTGQIIDKIGPILATKY